jgi:adenylate kinase family enzyme
MANKIIIVGNSGSGKTWLGERMARLLGVRYIALDVIFWEAGGYNRKRGTHEVQTDLEEIQNFGTWLVEGVFGHLVDVLIAFADTLIYMDLPWEECKKNLLSRGSESSRQLDPKKAEENFHALLEWAEAYETRDSKASKMYHDFLFASFSGDKYRICSRDDAEQLLKSLPTKAFSGSQKARSC